MSPGRGASSALELLRWGAGAWLLSGSARPAGGGGGTAPAGGGSPTLAVVIPARNEAGTLPTLLDSLSAQILRPHEVVVVDDGSEDATATLARSRGVPVVAPGPVPPGWTGKTWACQVGVASTSAPVLVFLDADVELAPAGLARLSAGYREQGGRGLLSVAPVHVAHRPHERLSALCQLVVMMGTGVFSPLPRLTAVPAAFGPCLISSRRDYEAVGGHGAVRAEMAEDMALARRFASHGLPVRVIPGRALVRIRMYPEGVTQLVEGWARTLSAGARATRPLTLALVVAWLSGLMSSALGLARTREALACGRLRRGVPPLLRYGAYGLQVEWLLGRVAAFGAGTGLGYPAPLLAFLVSFARSVALGFGVGRTRWKGRAVSRGRGLREPGSRLTPLGVGPV